MNKKVKRMICILCSVALVLSCTMVVEAASNPYPSTQNVDGDAYYEIPCTRFAWQQAYDTMGVVLPSWGNAVNWFNGAKMAGYSTGSIPMANSIAVWSGDYYGHVAYVTSVSGGNTFTVNEGGRTDLDHTSSHGVAYGYTLTNATGQSRPYDTGKTLLGFIYLTGSPTVSMSWGYDDCQPEQTNAFLYIRATADVSGSFTEAGITVWDGSGNVVGTKSEGTGISGKVLEIWYNLTNEVGIVLKPGTDYKYQFYAVFNGKRYEGPVRGFRTTGVSYVKGDSNDDGTVDLVDLRSVLRFVCGKTTLSEKGRLALDINADGKVDLLDLRRILRFICKKTNTL